MRRLHLIFLLALASNVLSAQTTTRPRPAAWDRLVSGGRFYDRFLPMPDGKLQRASWGADNVQPRLVDNGIEDPAWSFWGGNIVKGDDGLFHLFVCGWPENSKGGHEVWPGSIVFNAVSKSSFGPFKIQDTIGKGHNPEVYRLNDGRYVLYVIDGYYIADNINGPWTYSHFEFDARDRNIIEGLSNLTFAKREDGSYLMICRGGGVWISRTGLGTYNMVTQETAYPKVKGEFEDPVIWKDNIQYNLVVNDWLGRIAFYLRSVNGVDWIEEAGEAYLPGVPRHQDGSIEGWHKLERMKVYQDQYGRATQANFAVIDVEKKFDQGSDNHSSKNIVLPLEPGRLLTIMNKEISSPLKPQRLRLLIKSEPGFNPATDIDFASLRFGVADSVNFGGGSRFIKSSKVGNDLLLEFEPNKDSISPREYALKLLGRKKDQSLLYGYAVIPGRNALQPILTARLPKTEVSNEKTSIKFIVENFGQVQSKPASFVLYQVEGTKEQEIASGTIPTIAAYGQTTIHTPATNLASGEIKFRLVIRDSERTYPEFKGVMKL